MEHFSKSAYTMTTGISLLLHGILIACLFILGPPNPLDKPTEIKAIEVDIIPAATVDAGDRALLAPPDAPSTSASNTSTSVIEERKVPHLAPITASMENIFPSVPGETNDTSVTKTVSSGTEGAERSVAAGPGGEKSNAGTGEANDRGVGRRLPPAYLYGSKPAYPQSARKAGWEGSVVVRVLIDTAGTVESVSVREGSGYEILDEAAVKAVKKWRFSPAKKDDTPIASFHDVRVRFRLDGAE